MSKDGIDSVVGKRGLFMCQIASLSLLQRLKRSISGDAHDFNNIETWAVIKFFFLWGKMPKEIHAILIETLGEHAPSYVTIKNWVTQFKCGDFSTCDVPCPGQPKTVTTLKIIDQIHKLILEDRRISAKSIAEQLGISHEEVGSIIHEDLDMRKLSTKWVPKCLNKDQKHQRCQSSEQLLEFFQRDPNDFLSRLMTMDETSLYHYDLETKQQSMEWWHSGSACPTPKNFWVQKSAGKVLASIFWDQDGILLIIFRRARLSTQSNTHLCWCNWRIFWRKNAAGRSPRGSCSCTTMPRITGHLQPRRNWPTWASNVLTTHPILQIWPHQTTTCSLDWKTIERSPFFIRRRGHCCHGDLVGRTTFWIIFEWLAKVRAMG